MPRIPSAVHRHFEWNESSKISLCKLCGIKLKGNHASNLMNHLRVKHTDTHAEVLEINKTNISMKEQRHKIQLENENQKKRKQLLNCLVKLIAIHGRPFEILEDGAFQDLITMINADFVNDAKSKKIKELIIEKSYDIKEKISSELKGKMISIKMDSATCMDRQFIGINVQYIKNAKIVVRNLALMEIFVRQTAENLKSIILDVLEDFRIPLSTVYSITTDNGANYLKLTTLLNDIEDENVDSDSEEVRERDINFDSGVDFFNASDINETGTAEDNTFEITSIKCAAHSLQLCVRDALKKQPETESVIETCRHVVRILRRPLMKLKIRSHKLRKPIIDCNTRWASTYNMLLRLKELKPICDDCDEIAQIVDDNFWTTMNDILESLHPSAEATVRLQAEQLILSDFYSIWVICKTKTEKLQISLAKDIVLSMENRERNLMANKAFLAAIFMDPRWKIVLSNDEKAIAISWLKATHRQMIRIHQSREESINLVDEDSSSDDVLNAPSGSHSSNIPNLPANTFQADLQSLESILNETQRQRASGPQTLNFDFYVAEYAMTPRLAMTENVLDYWTQKLPHHLAETALVIIAAPATQVTVERLFSVLKFILTPSRNRLLDHTLKSIIRIKCNEDLLND